MAATAYAAVISLVHLMEQIQLYHARQPVFLDEQQRQLESLHENVAFLQDFLETYSREDSNEGERLESRIADVAYAAEDIIESYIVDGINARPRNLIEKIFNFLSERMGKMKYDAEKEAQKIKDSDHFSEGLKKIIEDMDFIKKEIANINQNSELIKDHQSIDLVHDRSLRRLPTMKNTMVVFEDDLNQIMGKLTTDQSNLQIIPITGMGGIGKTTLAKNIYVNSFIVQHFHVRGWITISQEYDLQKLLVGLLREIGDCADQNELECLESYQLGVKLHKYLSGRRYLIILDDMWSTKAWDDLQKFLPNNNNESRVIATTRLSNVANYIASSNLYKMNFLDERKSWDLLCRNVFGEKKCPPHLEDIGKQIAKSCKGLPLSISVIGGLLANSKMTRESWEYVVGDINEIINLEDDARCLKILTISYDQLPVYLKPCFLYLGSFREDHEIRVSKLIKLWIAERLLRPSKLESLEEVAENYLKDLIERNLVSVTKWGSIGSLKYCKIHDLLRDLCLRKAQEERFFCVNMVQNPNVSLDLSSPPRRIVIHHQFSDTEYSFQVSRALQSAGLARLLTCNFPLGLTRFTVDNRPSLKFRILRMLNVVDYYPVKKVFQLVNSRYLSLNFIGVNSTISIPSSIGHLWNLQTLIIGVPLRVMVAPSEIWEMPQLRHVMIRYGVQLPDPPLNRRVLENIQTLSKIINLRWTEEVLQKIPHIKKLKLEYLDDNYFSCRLNNLYRLHKLQSLTCSFLKARILIQHIEFPLSLEKLNLYNVDCSWEDINAKFGSLPNLKKLTWIGCCVEDEWYPVEGQFLKLKFLEIVGSNLVYWRADETHFPCLEHLVLDELTVLKEIPSEIGDISTLQSIKLVRCSSSTVTSANKILEEQRELGNEDLQLLVQSEIKLSKFNRVAHPNIAAAIERTFLANFYNNGLIREASARNDLNIRMKEEETGELTDF